jgi:replication factor C subunit 3/5
MNNTQSNENIPWVEKYRPEKFEDIILSEFNKKMFENMILFNYIPNLLFYGPPGTGKTTTIINLISKYQEKYEQKNKQLVIHLNASDERGIEVIRNQISQFVNTKNLFSFGMKFIILDEVDYMTKNAQRALHDLMQKYDSNVRFCLICNYISKIEQGLRSEFVRLRFNKLSEKHIISYLKKISNSEKLNLNLKQLKQINNMYICDVRSMINFMQVNQYHLKHANILEENSIKLILKKIYSLQDNNNKNVTNYITKQCIKYNIDKKELINKLFDFIINNCKITCDFLQKMEFIYHSTLIKDYDYIEYSILILYDYLKLNKNNIIDNKLVD